MSERPRYTIIESGSSYTKNNPRVKLADYLQKTGSIKVELNPNTSPIFYRILMTDEGLKLFHDYLQKINKAQE